jgi:hypothetical protein
VPGRLPDDEVIDVDGHVWEPDEVWTEHLDPAFLDRRPRIVEDDRHTTRYLIEDRLMPVGTGRGAWAPEGFREASLHRPGGVDPTARLKDMDTDGIDVAVLYGTLALGLWSIRDLALQVACCRAFNDWLAEYCRADPFRLRPAAALPLASIDAAVREAQRAVTELGAVVLTVHGAIVGRNLDDPTLFPLYEAAEGLDVALGVHAGGTGLGVDRFVDQYAMAHACVFPMDIMLGTTALLGGGVLERFGRLRVALLEAGCGWFPSFLERLDEHFEKRPTEMPGLTRPPSEFVADGRVVISCEPEEHGIAYAAERLGPGAVVYASDYPHWDAEFPGSVAAIRDRDDLEPATRRAILGGNARRLLRPRLTAPVDVRGR